MHELRHQLHKDWLTQASQYSLQGLWGASHTVFHDIGHIGKTSKLNHYAWGDHYAWGITTRGAITTHGATTTHMTNTVIASEAARRSVAIPQFRSVDCQKFQAGWKHFPCRRCFPVQGLFPCWDYRHSERSIAKFKILRYAQNDEIAKVSGRLKR